MEKLPPSSTVTLDRNRGFRRTDQAMEEEWARRTVWESEREMDQGLGRGRKATLVGTSEILAAVDPPVGQAIISTMTTMYSRSLKLNSVHAFYPSRAPYTEEARKNLITASVVLRVVFSNSGEVTNIRAISPLPMGLTEKAIAAARKIRFLPATRNGHPVSVYVQLEYSFNLY